MPLGFKLHLKIQQLPFTHALLLRSRPTFLHAVSSSISPLVLPDISQSRTPSKVHLLPQESSILAFIFEHRSAAIRAIRDVQINQLVTELHLLRSYFNEEQLQTPLLQFFKENLPNLSVVTNGKVGQCDLQWKEKDGILSMNQAGGKCMHASLLHQTSIAYPDCSLPLPSFGGFELSSKAVEENLLGAL